MSRGEIRFKLNRQQRRAILRRKDRTFTKKGYAFGHKIGGATLGKAEHLFKKSGQSKKIDMDERRKILKLPKYPPNLTNHERHFIRRKTREQQKQLEAEALEKDVKK